MVEKRDNEIRLGKALKDAEGDITSKFCKGFVIGDDGTLSLKNPDRFPQPPPAYTEKILHGGVIKHA